MAMRILDRERYWAFVKAYFICFTALVGLYVVIDAFSQLDEFAEIAKPPQLFLNMGRYYLIKTSLFYDQICGVITMMAAIFTVTWMQRNNELLAMLAAGISTQRIIRPVLVSALIVSSLAVVNQEFIMPRLSEELQKPPDDDGKQKIKVFTRQDFNDILVSGGDADREHRTILSGFSATIPVRVSGVMIEIEGREARYIEPGDDRYPLSGGWLIRGGKFLTGFGSKDPAELTHGVLTQVKDPSAFPPPVDPMAGRPGMSTYFLKTTVGFSTVTRRTNWYQFAPTVDLIRGLSDPTNLGERNDIEVFLHARLLRPLLGFNLMLLSLPLVLGGTGRNMFVNLGMSLGTSGVFYSVNFMSQYLGAHDVFPPELAAWAPLIVFGTIAIARWDTIRT